MHLLQLEGLPHPTDARAGRRRKLLEAVAELRCDAALVTHLANVRYLSGFTGSNGILLLTGRSAILFTDPRYDIQAHEECDCRVRIVRGSTWEGVWKHLAGRRLRVAMEADRVSHDVWLETARRLGREARLVASRGLVERLRRLKSPEEVEAIRASARVCGQAFLETARTLRPEMTERDAAAELDCRMRRLGADAPAFETIVAAGARAALPHARPGAARLGRGPVLIDMGASVGGWMSDMTRMVCLGQPAREFVRLFKAVREAQTAALESVRAGVPARRVDAAARRTLKQRGLDRFFTHSTGHGVGLEIHEMPRLGAKSDDVLEAGMVVTVEPGVYLAGTAGVRIEDTVLVTESGAEILTPVEKDLLVLSS
ncbi:MAG: aminopeptidase [Bryobacteraceae bacterium]|nr:MAG: aminopeptidase [Bryobacteraceae bacterium]